MEKIQRGFLLNWNRLLRMMMTILGFSTAASLSSCKDETQRAEYGTPSAKFIVNGQVKSEQDNAAIANIQVTMQGDTTFTDAQGKYEVDVIEFPTDQEFLIKFEDIDGTANGEYQTQENPVEFTDVEFTNGSGNWYAGETSETLDVNLKTKE